MICPQAIVEHGLSSETSILAARCRNTLEWQLFVAKIGEHPALAKDPLQARFRIARCLTSQSFIDGMGPESRNTSCFSFVWRQADVQCCRELVVVAEHGSLNIGQRSFSLKHGG